MLNKSANNAALGQLGNLYIGDNDYGQNNAQVVYGSNALSYGLQIHNTTPRPPSR